jgi:hypothetical protein
VRAPPADVRFSPFRWLIDHAGFCALPAAPYDDVQGPDVRERIGKNGVVFSAYPIPRLSGHFGQVDLDPLPQWAQSTDLTCTIPAEELSVQLGFTGDPERSFEFLGSRVEDVKAFLESDDFARARLDRRIARLYKESADYRGMLYELRPQLGLINLMKTLLGAYLFHRHELARYRRALRALGGSRRTNAPSA